MKKFILASFALNIFFLSHALAVRPDSLVKQRTVVLETETDSNVRVLFQWGESLFVIIDGGILPKPYPFRFAHFELFLDDKKITFKSSKLLLGQAAWKLYRWACHERRQSLILKHLIKNRIIPQYVYRDRDGKDRIDAQTKIKIMNRGLKIKFIDGPSQQKLGTAIIDNDSHEVVWIPAENYFARRIHRQANSKCGLIRQACVRLKALCFQTENAANGNFPLSKGLVA